jgi:hypothetical protein
MNVLIHPEASFVRRKSLGTSWETQIEAQIRVAMEQEASISLRGTSRVATSLTLP